jgi:hypothetical protein
MVMVVVVMVVMHIHMMCLVGMVVSVHDCLLSKEMK